MVSEIEVFAQKGAEIAPQKKVSKVLGFFRGPIEAHFRPKIATTNTFSVTPS